MMQTKFLLNQNCAEGHLGSKAAPVFPTPGFGFYSPLSVALFSVLLHAGSHGLSVCEALKNLVRQGYSKLLNSNAHTRVVQVKSALRSCPAFKEIEGKRYVLRFNRQNDGTISPTTRCNRVKGHGKKHRKINKDSVKNEGLAVAIERGVGVQKRIVQEEDMHLVGSGSNDMERCCPLDPKHGGCIQHTSLGSLYSDCGKQSGREGVKESASALEDRKDLGMVSCHVKDANQEDKLQVGRCRRTDGKRWRCRKKVHPGSIYCEHHHIMRRGGYKAKGVDASKAGEKSPSIRPSEALSGKCVVKEEEGLCLEPLKLADGSLQVSAAQSVATSCKLFAKEELIEAECETKPFLHTLESHNLEDTWRSKAEEKLSEPGQSVLAMAAMQEGQTEKLPASHIFEEERQGDERHDGMEETKQYLHRLGVDEHEGVERSKKEANATGHGQLVTVERTTDKGRQKAKPDLNTLEEEVLEEEEEKGEHHHLKGVKASVEGLEKVPIADVESQWQASIIPFKALTGKDVERETEKVLVESLRLATWPFGGSIAQVVASSSNVSVEEKSHKMHKEMSLFLPRLELNDLEGVQRLKKRPKLIGHGQSISLEKHDEQEETKPEQHVLEKLRYEVKQVTAPKLRVVVETHDLEDACRPNEAPRLTGHGQRTAEVDSPVLASEGLDRMQISQGDSMPGFHKSSTMLVPKKEASFNISEDRSKMYRGKGFHIEPSNQPAISEISSQNLKRRLVEKSDSSPSTEGLFLGGSLRVSKKDQSPTASNDLPGQCHRNDCKGWQCSRQCQPGCMYCEHYEGRLSGTSTNGKKKMILQLELDKHVLATCLKGGSETQILRVAIDVPETLAEGLKTKVSNRTGRPCEGTTAAKDNDALPLGRCHRKDGKGWQCAQQCKHGSIYCDRHQRQRSKSRFPRVHSQHKLAFSRGPDVQSLEYSSNIYTDDKQRALSATHLSNSGLEHAMKLQSRSQDSETRSGKQDDVGLALLSLRTPVGTPARAFHGSCLWEAKTLEQIGKADNAPKKCHRKDGKKWQCSQLCMPGYNHCEHHQGRGRKVKVIKI